MAERRAFPLVGIAEEEGTREEVQPHHC